MGVFKRCIDAVVDSEDPDSAWSAADSTVCQHCGERGLAQEFEQCAECPSSRVCSNCLQRCGGCGSNICPDCASGVSETTHSQQRLGPSWTPKTCAECKTPLCHSCRPGSLKCDRECSGCYKALCMGLSVGGSGEPCGELCITCKRYTCTECSIKIYDDCDTKRQCVDCAVKRKEATVSSDKQQELESPAPVTPPKRQRCMKENSPTEKKSRRITSTALEAQHNTGVKNGF